MTTNQQHAAFSCALGKVLDSIEQQPTNSLNELDGEQKTSKNNDKPTQKQLKKKISKKDKNPNLLKNGGTGGTGGTASNDAASSGSTTYFKGGTGGTETVSFTLFTSNKVLSKTFTLNSEGKIEKTATAQFYDGTAQRINIPFSDFVSALDSASPRQAAAYGLHDISYPDKVKIKVAGKTDPSQGILARTQDYYQFGGAGIFMIDHDPSEYGLPQTPVTLLALLSSIMPEFAQAARIERGSLSAGVHLPDAPSQHGKGFRLYFPVTNAQDIPRFADSLIKRLWLHGAGFIALSKSGAKLIRTVIDGSVYTPERLDFIGSPVIGAGLAYTPSQPNFFDGQTLDTSLLADLSQEELSCYEKLVVDAKQAIDPDSQTVKKRFIADKISEMVDGDVAFDVAHKTISAIAQSGFKQLYGDYLLDFKTAGKITVAELLKQGERFNNQPLADPIEGRSYGTTTAKFFWNKGIKPLINSFAHGAEAKYFLFAEQPLEPGEDYPNFDDRPCYKVFDDFWFKEKGGKAQKPGVWHFTATNGNEKEPPRLIDTWLCSPLHVVALSRSKTESLWGNVLRFKNKDGAWRTWNMPSRLLAGTSVELVAELADNGIEFDRKKREQIADYINVQHPKTRFLTAESIGWFETDQGRCFVLPSLTIGGDGVLFRGQHDTQDPHYSTRGTLEEWQHHVAALATGNSFLTLSISAGFSGALLRLLGNVDGFGIHAHFDSSNGKSTGLAAAASIWGQPLNYVKEWKTTQNGLEGGAMLFNDGVYCLDEMGAAEQRLVADALYTLANGRGKNRATVTGLAKHSNTWRVVILSNGESTIEGFLSKAGIQAQAGQLARFLNIPVNAAHGVHDELHGSSDGAEFSNRIKRATAKHYGVAGIKFLEHLISIDEVDLKDSVDNFAKTLAKGERLQGQEHRAATAFAVIGIAGELATEFGVTGWTTGTASIVAQHWFDKWREQRGAGNLEPRRVKEAITKYIESYSDARFTETTADTLLHGMRSGYWRMVDHNDSRVKEWLFSNAGLHEALKGFDVKRAEDILISEKWLIPSLENGKNLAKTKVKVSVNDGAGSRFYRIIIKEELSGSTGSTTVPVGGTAQVIDIKRGSTGSTGSTEKQQTMDFLEKNIKNLRADKGAI